MSEAVTSGENLDTESALDRIFLTTIGREDELLTPILVALWLLANNVLLGASRLVD
jgi:hypothetical protein